MSEDYKNLLEEEIKSEISNLSKLEYGCEKHTAAVESLNKLYKLKLEEDKNYLEYVDKEKVRNADKSFKNTQMKENVKDRYFRIGTAAFELILPLICYGVWMRRGFKFEENGTFTSQTFRGLFSRFKPTKK